jgi:hypothetical protein
MNVKFVDPNLITLRPEIYQFAFEMEKEMQKKDKEGYTHKDKSIEFLIDKLFEEREEVDECLTVENEGKWKIDEHINEELLHEGIMLALIRYKLKEENLKDVNEQELISQSHD